MSVGGRRCRPWVAALGAIALVGGAAGCSPSAPPAEVAVGPTLDAATAGRFAALALDCVHREYPNKIAHVLAGDEDVAFEGFIAYIANVKTSSYKHHER